MLKTLSVTMETTTKLETTHSSFTAIPVTTSTVYNLLQHTNGKDLSKLEHGRLR